MTPKQLVRDDSQEIKVTYGISLPLMVLGIASMLFMYATVEIIWQ